MTPAYETIAFQVSDHVAAVTLNRPDSRNALNSAMCLELTGLMARIAADSGIHAVVLQGAGAVFCAGADLKERKTMSVEEMTARRVKAFAAYAAIERLPQPAIAAVHGAAFGSGCEIAAACDFILASSETVFCYPEVGWGTVGATQRLPRIVGPRLAKELLFTSRKFGADEARAMGLVNQVHAPQDLAARAREMAMAIAARSPLTVRLTKRSIDQGLATTREGAMAVELLAIEENLRGSDWQGAIAAFGGASRGDTHGR